MLYFYRSKVANRKKIKKYVAEAIRIYYNDSDVIADLWLGRAQKEKSCHTQNLRRLVQEVTTMILYHGSSEIIEHPVFGKGSAVNDYGRGFYCTESILLAKEWACPGVRDGFSNKYEFDMSGLTVLNLNQERYHILNWLALLLQNRTFQKRSPISQQACQYILQEFLPDVSNFDVICGYRADDSYFAYAKDFLNNTISVRQLEIAMKLGNLGEQVVLKSRQAFKQIFFLGYEKADADIYNVKRLEREKQARTAYLQNHGADFDITDADLYIRDLMRQKVKNNDPRLW